MLNTRLTLEILLGLLSDTCELSHSLILAENVGNKQEICTYYIWEQQFPHLRVLGNWN